MHLFIFIAGLSCVLAALLDAFQTVILPRRATGRFRLTRLFYLFTWTPWSAVASRIRNPRERETALSFYGPLSLVFLIAAWAAALVFGFALMYNGLGSHFTDSLGVKADLRTDLYVSGTTLFTLGLGDVVPLNPWTREMIILGVGNGTGVCGRGDRLLSRCCMARFPARGGRSLCWMRARVRRRRRWSCFAGIRLRAERRR